MLAMLGIFAGILSLSASIPYIIDTIKGRTKPHRVTWGIFFLLNIIFVANQLAAGATSSVWLVVAFATSTFIIFALSLKRGAEGTSMLDISVLTGSLIGVVIWQLLDAPIASILANLLVASVASIPTYKKAWISPGTETTISYILSALAAFLSAISVGRLEFVLLLIPVYSVIYQSSVAIILKRHWIFRK